MVPGARAGAQSRPETQKHEPELPMVDACIHLLYGLERAMQVATERMRCICWVLNQEGGAINPAGARVPAADSSGKPALRCHGTDGPSRQLKRHAQWS